ncbi:MAG: hypothetical protein RL757_1609 [Bacteroidota bacterium]|jgi:hypothetical protein
MKSILDDWSIWLVASLTLGLAPFLPEPHLVGKIRWVLGGAVDMKLTDWFDLAMHGTPFLLLFRALWVNFLRKKNL